MAERDMERAEVAKATGHVGEMEQEISLLRDDQEQVSSPRGLVITLCMNPLLLKLIDFSSILIFFFLVQCQPFC